MTELGINLESNGNPAPPPNGTGRRRAGPPPRRRGLVRLVALLVVIVLILGGGYWAYGKADSMLNGPEDYTGQGTGAVTVEIDEGSGVAAIGRMLKSEGVVKSVDGFIAAANDNPDAAGIQPGFYKLREKMSSERAISELADTGNRDENKVLVREGARVGQIVTSIADSTDLKEKDLIAALEDPEALGLPDEADGNPEGYLYPATYTVEPGTTAPELMKQMVSKTIEVEEDLDIEARAEALGISKYEALIVASIIEYEASRDQDLAKVSRVIYNRLEVDMALQMDSTVAYVSKREGDVFTTSDERDADSAYNTYRNTGLPPTPIGSPGERTIEAALNPDKGNWLYFVAIDLESGETVFTDDYSEHLRNRDKLRDYCKSAEAC